ncbi:unnamed protein product [Angiostrongylus costaricensis]|uniref:Uncharacterized protein n=1 Tax=Angiostrongylus costaricensis TaxID=334426 RepID=A0A0R3PFM4_ANGCS|nr:unnamed protein product [Angiostrongylus costaricensis]
MCKDLFKFEEDDHDGDVDEEHGARDYMNTMKITDAENCDFTAEKLGSGCTQPILKNTVKTQPPLQLVPMQTVEGGAEGADYENEGNNEILDRHAGMVERIGENGDVTIKAVTVFSVLWNQKEVLVLTARSRSSCKRRRRRRLQGSC